MNKWDQRFMDLAVLVSSWSKDPETKVGAAVRGMDNGVLAVGFNGFPAELEDKPEWLTQKAIKRQLMIHAEMNTLLRLPPLPPRAATLYVTRPPCLDCAKLIVTHKAIGAVKCWGIKPTSAWFDSCIAGESLLESAGLTVEWYDAPDHGR